MGETDTVGDSWLAVMVTYRPTAAAVELARVVTGVLSGGLVVVDNGSGDGSARVLDDLADLEGVDVHRLPENLGIAAALNVGVREGADRDRTAVLTLDQDTRITPADLRRLVSTFDRAQGTLPAPGLGVLAPGVVGGSSYPMATAVPGVDLVATVDVIQSASVFPLSALRAVGHFRESLFIDSVDSEMCLRLRAAGYWVCADPRVSIDHAPGKPVTVRLGPWTATASGHSALRRYYITRNRIHLLRRFALSEGAWARHHARALAVQDVLAVTVEKDRMRKAVAILTGILHGALGREGPAPRFLRRG